MFNCTKILEFGYVILSGTYQMILFLFVTDFEHKR